MNILVLGSHMLSVIRDTERSVVGIKALRRSAGTIELHDGTVMLCRVVKNPHRDIDQFRGMEVQMVITHESWPRHFGPVLEQIRDYVMRPANIVVPFPEDS